MEIKYPTEEHRIVAEKITEYFSGFPFVSAVILTGSCARNRATKDSCLDIAILVRPGNSSQIDSLSREWETFSGKEKIFKKLAAVGEYSHVDLDFFTGDFVPEKYPHSWVTGPDMFEIEIGNFINYCVPLSEKDEYFKELRRKWLPFYSEEHRKKRLSMVMGFCENNLDHIPVYVERKLYFQAFDRLYNAYREFLQALFISKRRYPIAYNKWIKEQIKDILILPDLYERLVQLISVQNIESTQLLDKERLLRNLIRDYI
jgi:predicted nucleotidyltransferase